MKEKKKTIKRQSRELEKERLGVDVAKIYDRNNTTGENKLKGFGGLDLAMLTLGLATSLASTCKSICKKLGLKIDKRWYIHAYRK